MEVEREFDVDLPDAELRDIETIGQLDDLVATRLAISDLAERQRQWERLLDVIQREQSLERERLVRSARFVYDLGLD